MTYTSHTLNNIIERNYKSFEINQNEYFSGDYVIILFFVPFLLLIFLEILRMTETINTEFVRMNVILVISERSKFTINRKHLWIIAKLKKI